MKWVVDCKSVGDGETARGYLGRYLYRGVLRESDMLGSEGGKSAFATATARAGK